MPPIINEEKCIKCGYCAAICPLTVIKLSKDKKIVVKYPDEYWHCRACAIVSPVQAITLRYPLSHMMLHVDVPKKEC